MKDTKEIIKYYNSGIDREDLHDPHWKKINSLIIDDIDIEPMSNQEYSSIVNKWNR